MSLNIRKAAALSALVICGIGGSAYAEDSGANLSAATALQDMSPGWNLGNTLEAIGSGKAPFTVSQETAWGNPAATQALMNTVKAAGFKSVRIPVAWSEYADGSNTIDPAWMARVTEVVTYARNAGLYVVINVHWDGGWMQPTYADQAAVNAKLTTFWTQIASNFKSFDDHLLFAGTNEVMVTNVYSAPTRENCAVQNSFNQTFVNAVRATGGNNAGRFLVVQGYNTNIDYTVACNATLPADSAAGKLMMEVHYYDPYNFTLNANSGIWQWGSIATKASAAETWANEAYTDGQFQKMKARFIDKGVPVILGEYSAMRRTEYDATGKYRNHWDEYITRSAYQHGLLPMYWDNGPTSNHSSGLFDRAAATQAFPDTIAAIVDAGS
ncbi:glycoside hydrolase family 5 protein [Asticcacaulis sp.]|uniref:glycoside hydrolase family 5 protein n=1 Tax=Asticcacaulis sp. TaxID=1872648 RepID=UPI003F7B424A